MNKNKVEIRQKSFISFAFIAIMITLKGAGSGMAGMAAAIPMQNLVWRRHTNQK